MGLYDRPYYQDEPNRGMRLSVSGRTMIANIIIVNVVVFIIDVFVVPLFVDVASRPDLRLSSLLSVKPATLVQPWNWWQFVTYGFAHSPRNAYHVIGNMLGLYFLGGEVETLYGRWRFLRMYLTSLIICSLTWCVTERSMGVELSHLIGASGAVTTVMMLFALNFPRRTVLFMMFIPMPAWVLGVMLVVFNLFGTQSDPGMGDRVAYDVHLVGAAYGFLYFRTRWALGEWFGKGAVGPLKNPFRRTRLKIHDPESKNRDLDAKADAVLDKLHRQGEQSLTAAERRILEDYSRRMQKKRR